jgi:hypothetical protein
MAEILEAAAGREGGFDKVESLVVVLTTAAAGNQSGTGEVEWFVIVFPTSTAR